MYVSHGCSKEAHNYNEHHLYHVACCIILVQCHIVLKWLLLLLPKIGIKSCAIHPLETMSATVAITLCPSVDLRASMCTRLLRGCLHTRSE